MVKLILTHPGQAHADDYLACAIALAINPEATLERRVPTKLELDNPEIWVIDQGGVYDIEKGCFDHHHLTEQVCSVDLVLIAATMQTVATDTYPWLTTMSLQDCKGLKALADELKVPIGTINKLRGIQYLNLKIFETLEGQTRTDMMRAIGKEFFKGIDDRIHALKDITTGMIDTVDINGFTVVDMRHARGAYWLYMQEALNGGYMPELSIRKDGFTDNNRWVLYSSKPYGPKLGQLQGCPGVTFIHKNEFLAVVDNSQDPFEFIQTYVH